MSTQIAKLLVAALLEMSPYDIDEPLDKPDVPRGFRAERGHTHHGTAEKVSLILKADNNPDNRVSQRVGYVRYALSRHSQNPYGDMNSESGWVGVTNAGSYPVRTERAADWVAREAAAWKEEGWRVTLL